MIGDLYEDIFCVGPNSTLCYSSNFTVVRSLDNLWLNYFDMANIGGILGLGFDSERGSDFWLNNNFSR